MRQNNLCACGCGQRGDDFHHAIFGRRKAFPELNSPLNLVLVNHFEHINRRFDNTKWRVYFYEYNVKRYGQQVMDMWLNDLPAKLQGRVAEFRRLTAKADQVTAEAGQSQI
jgi:hypothetical protein